MGHRDISTTMDVYNEATKDKKMESFARLDGRTEMFLPMVDQSSVDDSTERWLDEIEKKIQYKAWYCGHWHTEKRIDKMHFLYRTFESDEWLQSSLE